MKDHYSLKPLISRLADQLLPADVTYKVSHFNPAHRHYGSSILTSILSVH